MKNIYKILALTFIAILFSTGNYAQQLGIYEFTGASNADNQFNAVTAQPSNATFSTFTRTVVTWNTAADVFNSKSFTTSGSINTGQYLQFTITANAGYVLNLTDISFKSQRSGLGPSQAKIAHNFSGNFTTDFQDFAPPTTSATQIWDFADITTADGGSVTFRLYGWTAASASGTLRIDDMKLNGTVTSAPLPVKLISFYGKKLKEKIQLNWSTATEINNSHFEIERSTDGKIFEAIGTVEGNGNSNQLNNYDFLDFNPSEGANYYRLKQIDFNGEYEYSKVIVMETNEKEEAAITAIAENKISIYSPYETDCFITLYDANGTTVNWREAMLEKGNNTVEIDMKGSTGLHILHVKNGGKFFLVKKFMQ